VKSQHPLRPLIIGEVLFDCFAEHRILGGAPFNVAWNLRGMGLDPLLVTAVGDDEHGAEVRGAMQSWGLDGAALQVDPEHATGRVDVTVAAGEPSYRFWEDVAFDHIAPPPAATLEQRFGLLYHGSLVFRSPHSRSTIVELKRSLRCPVFVDINIRRPYFDLDWAAELIDGAEHVKLNLDELWLLAGDAPATAAASAAPSHPAVGVEQPGADWETRRRCAEALQQQHRIGNLWITAGAEGAGWIGPAGEFQHTPAHPVAEMVDTVGAGDAFAAMIIRGILAGTPPQESLRRAAAFAARVCGIRGAGVADHSFYPQQEIA
jgi:fructokinase